MRPLRPIGDADPDLASGAVELRGQGVSGTPPEQMLDSLEVDRVSGDDVAGSFSPSGDR